MDRQNQEFFGRMPDGREVHKLTLRDGACACEIITYGGAVRSLTVPDRDGNPVDVVLGFDTLEDYMAQDKYIGALIGRYANRIGGAKFTLNGVEYTLARNDGENSLHGGNVGFDKQVWTVEELSENAVTLSLTSPDGQEGYPGTLKVRVTYTLDTHIPDPFAEHMKERQLSIEYRAVCDKDTIFNPTNHTYFNLSGHDSGPVDGQEIGLLYDSRYTPVGPGSIPTGEIAPVDGTFMDLRRTQPIGACIDEDFDQLAMAGGWDHNWAIDGWDREASQDAFPTLFPAAWAWSPDTCIAMECLTTLPGVQFYAGNYLDGRPAGKGGAVYGKRCGFCLETQFFPDTPNHPNFPSCVLRAGEKFYSKTIYGFCS